MKKNSKYYVIKFTKHLNTNELKQRLMAMGVTFNLIANAKRSQLNNLYYKFFLDNKKRVFISNKIEQEIERGLYTRKDLSSFRSVKQTRRLRYHEDKSPKSRASLKQRQNKHFKQLEIYQLIQGGAQGSFKKTIKRDDSDYKISHYFFNRSDILKSNLPPFQSNLITAVNLKRLEIKPVKCVIDDFSDKLSRFRSKLLSKPYSTYILSDDDSDLGLYLNNRKENDYCLRDSIDLFKNGTVYLEMFRFKINLSLAVLFVLILINFFYCVAVDCGNCLVGIVTFAIPFVVFLRRIHFPMNLFASIVSNPSILIFVVIIQLSKALINKAFDLLKSHITSPGLTVKPISPVLIVLLITLKSSNITCFVFPLYSKKHQGVNCDP